jgi:probable HAF family extracellular repeat protein
MSTRSVAVNGKSGPIGMPETKQARRHLARKRQSAGAGWQPLRSIGRAMGAGVLALVVASTAGADPTGTAPGGPRAVKVASAAAPLPKYILVDIGTLEGGGSSAAFAINTLGQVAGWSNSRAVVSDLAGTHDLGVRGLGSGACGINDSGQVVGYSYDVHSHAFLYSGGVLRDIGTLGGHDANAWAINNSGQVVGAAQLRDTNPLSDDPLNTGPQHAFLYDSGGMHDLGTLGGRESSSEAINDVGQVVGTSDTSDGGTHAFLWVSGTMKDLGGLAGYASSTADGINASGEVVGGSLNPEPQETAGGRAFLYDSAGMHDLGTLGGNYSLAFGINAGGQIVGDSLTGDNKQHAFLYSSGAMIDLNDLLPASSSWVLNEARAINDAGQIVGVGTLNGRQRAFLLTLPTDPRLAPPAAPSGLSVKMASTSELDLTWTDNSNNENSFEVQSTTSDDGSDWRDIGTVPANTTTFAHTGLQPYTHYTYRVRAVNVAGASGWSNEASGDTGFRPLAAISDDRGLDFGSQGVGTPSGAQTVTVTNEGNGPLDIHSITVTGRNASEFSLVPAVPTPQTLAPGASLTVSLVFTPAAIGSRTAALTFADNEPRGSAAIGLSGTGIAPVLRLSAATLDFGPQPMGLSGDLALLLRNTGDAPLTVSSLAIQGPDAGDFSLPPGGWTGGTLQPGDITLLNVRFNPAMTGSRTASLVITDDAVGGPHLVALTGVGTAPLLRLSADSLIFGLQSPGAAQSVTFTNSGDAPLAIQSLALGGPDVNRFQIVSDTGEKSLDPGASRTLTISFSPATIAGRGGRARIAAARIAATGYTAILEIHDNDPHPGSPHQITLAALAPPPAPSSLTATVAAGPQVTLTWSNASPDAKAYLTLWRQDGSGTWTRVALLPGDATTFTDSSVTVNTSYTYRAHLVNGAAISAWSDLARASTVGTLVAAPSNLAATVGAGPQVRLTWSDPNPNAQAYLTVWRQDAAGSWTRVALLAGNASRFTDPSVLPGATYSYRAHLVNGGAVSAWSNLASATTPTAGPAHLTATVGAGPQVRLTWSNAHPDAKAYVTVWRQDAAGTWTRVALLAGDATSFTDTLVAAGGSYRYQAHGVSGAAVSEWSNGATAVVPAAGAP